MLVLVHDVEKLEADGLDLSGFASFVAAASALASGTTVEVRRVTNTHSLRTALASFRAEGRTFDVVVSIGHSNEQGIRASSDWFAPWADYAGLIKVLSPRRLMLVACRAGRWPAAAILFQKLPKLRRIFASPLEVSLDMGALMLAMTPYLLEVKAPPSSAVVAMQTLLLGTTGRLLRQWRRDQDRDSTEGALLDVSASLLDPLLRQIPSALRSWLG